MKKTIGFSLIVILLFSKVSIGQECPIIPLPNHYENVDTHFLLNHQTMIVVEDKAFMTEADYLKSNILKLSGIAVTGKNEDATQIVFRHSDKKELAKKGAYELEMNHNKVIISASHRAGAFYGGISLLQMIAKTKVKNHQLSIPCWNITDSPNYMWRGFMLDESRHFFGKKVVKELLDQMAWLKFNRFHWHLTDAPGWRLQIKGYPLLTLVGGIGNYGNPNASAKYYTQEEIKEIVAYAKARHIEVIPEIDMPGHATASNRAYPEFSGGGTGRYADFTFNPGKDSTYQYLTNILKEVSVLFPFGMIHLGGDEVSFGIKAWEKDLGVQQLMKKKGFEELTQVENYFFNRMADSSLKFFNKILAWDEAVDGSLSPQSSIIFWWRHNKPQQLTKALKKGYNVVLCPRIPLYFDFVEDSNFVQGRKWGKSFSSVKEVYNFTPEQYVKIKAKNKNQILGMQANLWTEKIKSQKRLEFMTFPRITALSEAAWTQPKNRDYKAFLSRLKGQLILYDRNDIFYFDPIKPERTPEVVDQNLRLNIN